MSKVEVLVATMHQKDYSLLEKMNIHSNVIVGNQCDHNELLEFSYNQYHVKWLSFHERGVGLNRNNALMRATSEVCLFADDDMIFYDDYEETVLKQFSEYPDADVLIFNIDEKSENKRRKNHKVKKITLFNYMNYGAARFAIKRKAVSYHGISFNLNFGGGTFHSCGEDTLFLRDCLKAKLKIYAVPLSISYLSETRDSSWFEGYTEKYFFDKGVILGLAHPKLCKAFAWYLVLRHKEYKNQSRFTNRKILKIISEGIKYVKKAQFEKSIICT